jgi:predicted nucleic acid-binding protein
MILVDTSVWILIFRDKTGEAVDAFRETVGSEPTVLSRFNQLELLQGAKTLKDRKTPPLCVCLANQ